MTDEEAIDILKNIIADEVIGTYCIEIQKEGVNCSKNCENEDCYLIQAIDTATNLIQKKDTEINKLNNVIDRMAEMINSHDIDEDICSQFGKTKDCSLYINDEKACINCIKEYFMKEK